MASTAMVGGCFAYRTTQPAVVRTGEVVRLTLTDSGAQQLTQQVGPRVETLDGRVISSRDSALELAVTQLTRARLGEEFWTGDRVMVPMRGVGSLTVRKLDRKRSALATGGALVGLLVMRQAIVESAVFGSRVSRPPGSK